MKTIRAIIFAYFPSFWLFQWLFDKKCLDAAKEAQQKYRIRRLN